MTAADKGKNKNNTVNKKIVLVKKINYGNY